MPDKEVIYFPKCIMFISLNPYFAEYEKMLYKIWKYSQNIVIESNEHIMSGDHYSQETEAKPKGQKGKTETRKKIISHDCIITIPIDKIIGNLLIEFPLPPRGIFKVEYNLITTEKLEIRQTKMNELPLIDVDLKLLFLKYDTKTIINIYFYLLLETRIIFFSTDLQALNIFISGFLSLLFPFQYPYQVITILPLNNYSVLESITPFIVGINREYEENFFEKSNLTQNNTFLIVDINKGKINLINVDEEFPDFPKSKKLEKNIDSCVNKYFGNLLKNRQNRGKKKSLDLSRSQIMSHKILHMKNDEKQLDTIEEELENFNIDFEFNKEINYIFFNFNANLFSNYSKYLNLDFYSSTNIPNLKNLFQLKDFLNEVPQSEKGFYEKFMKETQLFIEFLYKRMIPKSSKEKIQVLMLDEQINKLYTKNPQQNIFLDSKEYNFYRKFFVPNARGITKQEEQFYKDKNNQIKLLSYGIIIEDDKDNIIFNYPVFPRLTTEFFFLDTLKEYLIPEKLNENIESINEDIISKSHLGGIITKQDDMINYVYFTWMEMLAMTFWYCEEEEKKYWFQELIKVIQKLTSHEMEIYNILFETLVANGKEYMVLKLYDIILQLHLNPSFKVHSMVMEILDKKKQKNDKAKISQIMKNNQSNPTTLYNKQMFQIRTFKSKYLGNILTDKIKFYNYDLCIHCQKDINLELLCLNYKNMSREYIWGKCPFCNEHILPKITIQYGTEINKSGKLKFNTSRIDCIILFSPYFLKINTHNSLNKQFGIKLDVDQLMTKYNIIFWNLIWYFRLYQLEFDFISPYRQRLRHLDCNVNLLLNTFDLEACLEKEKIVYDEKEDNSPKFETEELKIEHFEILIKK